MSSRIRLGGLDPERAFEVVVVTLLLLLAAFEEDDGRFVVLSPFDLDGDLDDGVGEEEWLPAALLAAT